MFQWVMEIVIFLSVIWAFWTQVAYPIYKGTKLFPIFRKKLTAVSDKIQEAGTDLEAARLEQEAQQLRDAVKQTKNKTK
jgi:hypothetical protein